MTTRLAAFPSMSSVYVSGLVLSPQTRRWLPSSHKRFIAECGQEPVPDRGGLDQRVYSQSAGDWKSNDHPRRVDTDEQPEGRRRNAASHLDANEKMLEEHHQAEGQKNDRESYSEKTAPEGYDYTRSFADQIDDWVAGKIPTNDTLVLGPTPEVFQKIGLSALPMTIDQKHIDYAVNSTKNEDHNLELEMLKKLPEMMENPVAIIESDSKPTDSAVVILRGKVSGKQHIAAVHISGNGKINGLRIDTNHLASTYGRKNAISKLLTDAIKKENANQVGIFYWQKVAARTLFVESGEQFPGGAMQDGFIYAPITVVRLAVMSNNERECCYPYTITRFRMHPPTIVSTISAFSRLGRQSRYEVGVLFVWDESVEL